MKRKKPELLEVDTREVDDLLRRAKESLNEKDFHLVQAVFESYAYLAELVEDKNTSIARLRRMLFGARTEKTRTIVGQDSPPPSAEEPAADPSLEAGDQQAPVSQTSEETATSKKGHGRNRAEDYPGADQVEVLHESLQSGDPCPECQQGTVYDRSPGVLVRLTGQAPLAATVYQLQKLRCNLCGEVFTAQPPPEARGTKYDAQAASMIALLKYGSGMPFNRLAGLQRSLGIPLPASTQWDIVQSFTPPITPAYEELIRQAAQGEVLHNDDTTVKILEWMGKRAKAEALKEQPSGRTGLFTSGVVATGGGQRIALFFSGRKHAGENLAEVLKLRAEELQRPIQMCDPLSRNLTGELKTIVANCLAHARRQFADVYDHFPEQCRYVLEALKVVYQTDAHARQRGLSPQQRQRLHRIKSQHRMQQLHTWLHRQLDQKMVEPNSGLGQAIRYMLRHWEKLTLFLREPGAPLDNNICEQALKRAILHRKNALFYKTQNGARVGDMYMSLIHTCQLCGTNALDYLTALMQHGEEVASDPQQWMPWNYEAALQRHSPAKEAGRPRDPAEVA